jgi:uncharacterized membrane protein YphA (DoxX/SURF4 family)
MPDPKLIRLSIALVWIYQGFWCKICGAAPSQAAMLSSVPLIGPVAGHFLLIALGIFESCIGAWVLSGWRLRRAAVVQTVLLVAMNTGGVIWAGRLIPDPAGMVLQNFAFLMLIWVSAGDRDARALA